MFCIFIVSWQFLFSNNSNMDLVYQKKSGNTMLSESVRTTICKYSTPVVKFGPQSTHLRSTSNDLMAEDCL